MTEWEKELADQKSIAQLVQSMLTQKVSSVATEQFTEHHWSVRLDLLESYWVNFRENDLVLQRYAKQIGDRSYFKNKLFDVTLSHYLDLKTFIIGKIQLGSRPPPASNRQSVGPSTTQAALESVKLPKFRGNQRDWESWKEQFTAMVIDDAVMAPIIKFQRLKNCLEDEAFRAVAGINMVADNFNSAWEALCSKYDNKPLRFLTQMQILQEMPTSTKETAPHLNQLLNTAMQSLSNFTALGRPVQYWDDILNFFVINKFSDDSRLDWIKYSATEKFGDFPKFSQLKIFLEQRIRSLELAQSKSETIQTKLQSSDTQENKTKPKGGKKSTVVYHTDTKKGKVKKLNCIYCHADHFLAYCQKFVQIDIAERKKFLEAHKLCPNCFNLHALEECNSNKRCFICAQKHHTKIHLYDPNTGTSQGKDNQKNNSSTTQLSAIHVSSTQIASEPSNNISMFIKRQAFLATAILTFSSANGRRIKVRCLLDTGAEDSFFSEYMVQNLALSRTKTAVVCSGVGGTKTSVSHAIATAFLHSTVLPEFSLEVTALVLKRVAGNTPSKFISTKNWSHLQGLTLADPTFNIPGRIDCILGTEVFAAILGSQITKGLSNQPAVLETVCGWIVFGAENSNSSRNKNTRTLLTMTGIQEQLELSKSLKLFWEIEEVPNTFQFSPEEQSCYQHFKDTHSRDANGRFVLRLPFKETPVLPDTRPLAEAYLNRLFKRFDKEPSLAVPYTAFMQEYLNLGHMEIAASPKITNVNYIPHHGIFKGSKIRVVFNASQRFSNGQSLNSFLHIGPKLQEDVLIIILRWAFYHIVFTCDVVKMFRQFLVHEEDRDWQRIVWKSSIKAEPQVFRLNTVTYGEACAPFQANACMLQLADDEQFKFPKAAKALRRSRYVDDIYVGDDSTKGILDSRDQLIQILASAGMTAGKWASNRVEILQSLPSLDSKTAVNLLQEQDVVSTLGLRWLPDEDVFNFKISITAEIPKVISRRFLLSEISKLYDPIGFLCPVVIRGKILLQNLWLSKLGWDDPVSKEVSIAWTKFRQELISLESIKIPRWLGIFSNSIWDLHCFCDASKRAYAAALYVVVSADKAFSSKLLVAKSKVAPIKVLSIPKLELCGAALLAKLVNYLLANLIQKPTRVYCWSDSRVTLAWLQSHPSRWKMFVANRVSYITTSLPSDTVWGYVRTTENPADLPTRGLTPSELRNSSLWWQGPMWLSRNSSQWPSYSEQFSTDEESSHDVSHIFIAQEPNLLEWTEQFSSIDRLIRILAFIYRWRINAKQARGERSNGNHSSEELQAGLGYLLKIVQRTFFNSEINTLIQQKKICSSSVILRLSPKLDSSGLLRVGGRLQNAFLTEDEKHPIILPTKNHISKLLVEQAHRKTCHGGPTVVQSHMNRMFWLVRGRNYIRKIIHDCVRCARYGGKVFQQQMAPLPAIRTRPARPFTHTGVDYAGPFYIRHAPGRGQRAYKSYVAIFVCMVVRAVHIEVVSDLTSAAFLAAFKRFVARRGLPNTMYSDNGTNFKGADEELHSLFKETSAFNEEVAASIAKEGVKWSFIPPRAPHFGGLWETNVRSFKIHLFRVIGSNKLTYEEFSTVSASIEACLNSRPLSPISNNEEDLSALTPGHFLIGAALTSVPEPFTDTNEFHSAHSRWHLLTLMKNHFWKRWKAEFLHQMQQRSKWLYPNQVFQVGDLVLYKDEQLPASKWPLARILHLYLGKDSLSRVAVIKTVNGKYTRALNRLIKLPINEKCNVLLTSNQEVMVGGEKI